MVEEGEPRVCLIHAAAAVAAGPAGLGSAPVGRRDRTPSRSKSKGGEGRRRRDEAQYAALGLETSSGFGVAVSSPDLRSDDRVSVLFRHPHPE